MAEEMQNVEGCVQSNESSDVLVDADKPLDIEHIVTHAIDTLRGTSLRELLACILTREEWAALSTGREGRRMSVIYNPRSNAFERWSVEGAKEPPISIADQQRIARHNAALLLLGICKHRSQRCEDESMKDPLHWNSLTDPAVLTEGLGAHHEQNPKTEEKTEKDWKDRLKKMLDHPVVVWGYGTSPITLPMVGMTVIAPEVMWPIYQLLIATGMVGLTASCFTVITVKSIERFLRNHPKAAVQAIEEIAIIEFPRRTHEVVSPDTNENSGSTTSDHDAQRLTNARQIKDRAEGTIAHGDSDAPDDPLSSDMRFIGKEEHQKYRRPIPRLDQVLYQSVQKIDRVVCDGIDQLFETGFIRLPTTFWEGLKIHAEALKTGLQTMTTDFARSLIQSMPGIPKDQQKSDESIDRTIENLDGKHRHLIG